MSRATNAVADDPETRLDASDHESLRLWLRLFTCAKLIERRIDAALKREFGSTLPRFDLLAQLHRVPTGLRMGELSARTLTSGGNVTWLVSSLERDGLVSRRAASTDRRAMIVRLTAAGRRHFEAMARAHEAHVERLLSGVPRAERRTLHTLLGTVKQRLPTDATGTEP